MQLPKGHSRDWKRRKPSKKAKTLKNLDATLWRWFSKYVRLRDRLEGTTCLTQYCICITCGTPHKWDSGYIDAGHFATRNKLATKFNEQNVNAQCKRCNKYGKGEQARHAVGIDEKYGKGTAEKLLALSSQHCKLDRMWYEYMIEEYKKKVKGLLSA